jgi:hypothetical protein
MREWMYRSAFSWPRHWLQVSGQLHVPAALLIGLYYLEKVKFLTLPGLELRTLSRPARSQSLYRLHYPRSEFHKRQGISSPAEQLVPPRDGKRSVQLVCLRVLFSIPGKPRELLGLPCLASVITSSIFITQCFIQINRVSYDLASQGAQNSTRHCAIFRHWTKRINLNSCSRHVVIFQHEAWSYQGAGIAQSV